MVRMGPAGQASGAGPGFGAYPKRFEGL